MADNTCFLAIDPRKYDLPDSLADDVELIDRLIGRLLTAEGEERVIHIARKLYEQGFVDEHLDDTLKNSARIADKLLAEIGELEDPAVVSNVLRAFTIFFQLVNIAEQKAIVHANRRRQVTRTNNGDEHNFRPESIGSAISRLARAGVTAEEMQTLLNRVDIVPTITAHPTEARRRAVMDKLLAFADAMAQREMPAESARLDRPLDLPKPYAEKELFRQLVALWNTDELRSGRMSVMDEVSNSVYFFQRTIIDVVAWLHHDLRAALEHGFPGHQFTVGSFIRYHSWVGGDRDGNPNVTPEITWQTVLYHQHIIISHYLSAIGPLKREMSLSSRLITLPEELTESLNDDSARIQLSPEDLDRFKNQPFALKLTYMEHRLRATLERLEQLENLDLDEGLEAHESHRAAYHTAEEFARDLEIINRALQQPATRALTEGGQLHKLTVQSQTFGFQLASLDIREHSEVHEAVLDEILVAAGVLKPGELYSELPEERKLEILERELRSSRPLLSRGWTGSDQCMKTLRVFDTIRYARQMLGGKSITSYVISMTHQVSDMLEVLILAKEAGLVRSTFEKGDDGTPARLRIESELDIVPLFETIEDLQHCDTLLNNMFKNEAYRLHLDSRNNFQELMLGYSDSSKDGGYLAANWNLQDTQDKLARACRAANVDFRFFHGRGGTVGRGGGRASRAILSQPRGSFTGRIRFTEQGEVVSFRYALRPMAHRHLEQIVNSVLLAVYDKPDRIFGKNVEVGKATPSPEANGRSHDNFGPAMTEMANYSRKVYRAMVHEDDEFWEFYAQATPIAHISHLPITSRPAARGGGALNGMHELRAIPWVFAWVQSRYVVPGWYGLGAALEYYANQAPENLDNLRDMYNKWPFFRTVVDNAQLELVRTHLPTAALYAGRVRPESLGRRFHENICAEYERAAKWVVEITGKEKLLDNSPVVQSTVRLRNPAVFPINHLQVVLMELWDRLSEDNQDRSNPWNEPLLLSLTSLAAGMQSTG